MVNLNSAVITTRFVLENSSIIVSVFKDNDGEWQFFDNEEGASEKDARVISLGEILQIDPTLKEILEIDNGSHAYREDDRDSWKIEKYNK